MKTILGWDLNENLHRFEILASKLSTEGKQAYSEAVWYLITRLRIAEETLERNNLLDKMGEDFEGEEIPVFEKEE